MAPPTPLPRPEFGRVFSYALLRDFRRGPAAPLEAIRGMNAAIVWQSRPGLRRVRTVLRIAGMALRLPIQIASAWLQHAESVRRACGRGRAAQLVDLWRITTRRALTPRQYYGDGIYRAVPSGLDQRLFAFSVYASVCRRLAAERDPRLRDHLHDKARFAATAAAHGLAAVPTLALVEPGNDAPALPSVAFLAKPNRGMQGLAVEAWRPVVDGHRRPDGLTLAGDALRAHLADLARRHGAILLQPLLSNHPDFMEFAGDALSTTRVMTLVSETGEPEVVDAAFRASTAPGAVVDNFHAGGHLFPIDVSTGRLTCCCLIRRDGSEPRRTRPIDDPQRVGKRHPAWAAVSGLALRCHRAFPGLFIAGWDIAMTPGGPVVIEVNIPPGLTVPRQLASGNVAGSRLIALLGWHAERWLECNTPAGSRWRPPRP